MSKNHANAELHFDCYFFTGNDVSTIANDHVSGTKESWNCLQTTGQIDGVTWSDVMANRLLRDKEHTIAATYTFAAPTKKLHFQEEILGNGDEDNAELNGQKISSMRTAKEIWGAVGTVKVARVVQSSDRTTIGRSQAGPGLRDSCLPSTAKRRHWPIRPVSSLPRLPERQNCLWETLIMLM